MVICLTKQVKALESIRHDLEKNISKTCRFNYFNKYRYINSNKENMNLIEKSDVDSKFGETYITSIYQKYIDFKDGDYDFSKAYDYIEKAVNHIKRNKKVYRLLITLLATTINFGVFGITTSFALEGGSLGYKLYIKGVEICKIICILGFMVEAGKCVLTGTLESLWRIAVVYCSFMLSIRYLPDIVDWFFTK